MRAVLVLLLVIAGATACRTGAAVDAHKAFSDPAVAAWPGRPPRAMPPACASGSRRVGPNAQGDRGVTPLELAMLAQSVDGMCALLAAGADSTVGRPFDAGGGPRPALRALPIGGIATLASWLAARRMIRRE